MLDQSDIQWERDMAARLEHVSQNVTVRRQSDEQRISKFTSWGVVTWLASRGHQCLGMEVQGGRPLYLFNQRTDGLDETVSESMMHYQAFNDWSRSEAERIGARI